MKTVFFSVVHNDLNLSSKTAHIYLYVAAVSKQRLQTLWRTQSVFSLMGIRAFIPWHGSSGHWTFHLNMQKGVCLKLVTGLLLSETINFEEEGLFLSHTFPGCSSQSVGPTALDWSWWEVCGGTNTLALWEKQKRREGLGATPS